MASQVTFTGKIGPAVQLTTRVFADVRRLALDFEKRTLQLNYVENSQPYEAILDTTGTMTLTDTVTANQHVIVVSVT